MPNPPLTLKSCARVLAVWAIVGLGFALPISPALSNIMQLFIVIGWSLSGEWAQKWAVLKHSRAVHAIALLLVLILVGTSYGEGSDSDKLHYLTKYSSLLLAPVLLSLQLSPHEKWRALWGFCAAMLLTLFLSCMIWLDWLPNGLIEGMDPSNPVVFKRHITHGFFMAIAAFFLYFMALKLDGKRAFVLFALAVAAVGNALLMIQGRTGQAVLMVLLIYIFHLRFPRKGLLAGVIATLILAVGAYAISPGFKARADLAAEQATHWQARTGYVNNPVGIRFDYYSTTIAIIKEHPFLGVGTGGFPSAYLRQIEGTSMAPSNNPHNQYLLLTSQLGLVGLLVLLGMYVSCWRQALLLPYPFAQLAIGILLAYLVGNLFNSFMLDFSERLFFVWAIGILLSQGAREPLQAA